MSEVPIKNIYIYPYTSGSESAKLLAERLGALRIKLTDSEYKHKPGNLVINWGNSNCPYPCLNPAESLRHTVDKLGFFRLMNAKGLGSATPEYWTHYADIPEWAYPVLCRTTTTGRDGAGIVIANSREELVDANLYTRLYANADEYRVTVFKGQGVTDIQAKRKRQGVECLSEIIKTYSNGWGFQRVHQPMDGLSKFAEEVLAATSMDFAGFDVIYTNGKYVVLEANSAMGLEGQALERFAKAVEGYIAEWNKAAEIASEPILEAIPEAEVPVPPLSLEAWAESCPSGYTKDQILTAVINLSL